MQNTTVQSQHRFIGIKAYICYIHGYCSLIGSCSTLIGDNESYLETFMIYCKDGRLYVCFIILSSFIY